jgi:UDP-GlcNAc3NAcA epimerase
LPPPTRRWTICGVEGIASERIVRTGDVMADTARLFGAQAEAQAVELLAPLTLPAGPFILATIHRAENTDDPARLEASLTALGQAPLPVLLPLYLRTRARIAEQGLEPLLRAITLWAPLGFLAMVLLERRAALVVTDSDGVQKEAFLQGTPCITMRAETEWVELLECGWNKLANPGDAGAVLEAIQQQLALDTNRHRPPLYGNGHATDEIVAMLQQNLRNP